MRPRSGLALAALLLLIPGAARGRIGDLGKVPDRGPHRPARADSARTLAGPWQVWGHGGYGWLGSPADVRSRYIAGLDAGASGDRRFGDRVAVRARLEYHDFPSKQPDVIFVNGYPYTSNTNYGHGWLGSALGGAAVRVVNHIWIEGGGGGGYLKSGFPAGQTYVDPISGRPLPLNGGTGWGGLWSAGARYEFKPNARDRLLAELQFLSMDRGGTTLHVWALCVGYRLF